MPNIGEDAKRARHERVNLLVQKFPDGISENEIADTLNYERRSVNNYLRDLDMEGKVYKDGKLWFPLPYMKRQLRRMEITPEEGMALYLASRLLVQQSDYRNEVAEQALLKLATVMHEDAQLSRDIYRAAQELVHRETDHSRQSVFKFVMQAHIYRKNLQIIYQPYKGKAFETIFSPYLIEPSAIGYATYAIGYSSAAGAMRTYKIERIQDARLLREDFEIPQDFDGIKILRNAWSIYYGDEVIRVVLRFHPDVAKRIKETVWHPSQQLADDPEDPAYVQMQIEVADTTDLKPWIRTWGANCEVLEPENLRREFKGEARRQAYLYGWSTSSAQDDDHSRFDDIFGS